MSTLLRSLCGSARLAQCACNDQAMITTRSPARPGTWVPDPVLARALTALRDVKDAPGDSVPAALWRAAQCAHNELEEALQQPAPPAQPDPFHVPYGMKCHLCKGPRERYMATICDRCAGAGVSL